MKSFPSDNTVAVTGTSLPSGEFNIPITTGKPSLHLLRVIGGSAAGLLVKGYLTPTQCRRICDNFRHNAGLHARQDNVSGITVGADQYGKDGATYIRDSRQARSAVEDLFAGAMNVPTMLRADIQRLLPPGIAVRPAVHDGIEFNHCRAVGWTDAGTYALKLHDDLAQLNDPRQRDFETARVANPIAFNIYPSVTDEGGELEVINLRPDEASKRRLGIEHSGYPYPVEALTGYDRLVIRPDPGDLLIIAGSLVHGVRGIRGKGFRLLLNHFAGFIDDQTFITWS